MSFLIVCARQIGWLTMQWTIAWSEQTNPAWYLLMYLHCNGSVGLMLSKWKYERFTATFAIPETLATLYLVVVLTNPISWAMSCVKQKITGQLMSDEYARTLRPSEVRTFQSSFHLPNRKACNLSHLALTGGPQLRPEEHLINPIRKVCWKSWGTAVMDRAGGGDHIKLKLTFFSRPGLTIIITGPM